MLAFELDEVMAEQAAGGHLYHEFLRVPRLSMGLYVLPAGSDDPQGAHDEAEVYYVVSGRATLRVADEERPVQAGSIVYVGAEVEHKFHSITEDLKALVFFEPAEGS